MRRMPKDCLNWLRKMPLSLLLPSYLNSMRSGIICWMMTTMLHCVCACLGLFGVDSDE